jgi:hypothetical protein
MNDAELRSEFRGRYPVSNLSSTVSGNDVTLSWEWPVYAFEPGRFYHHTWPFEGSLSHLNMGLPTYIKAARFAPADLIGQNVAGGILSHVQVLVSSGQGGNTTTWSILLWTVEPGEEPDMANPLFSSTNSIADHATAINSYNMTLPPTLQLEIPFDKELWIGIRVTPSGNHHSAALDPSGPAKDGYGNMIWTEADGWFTLLSHMSNNRNFLITGVAADPDGQMITFGNGTVNNDVSFVPIASDITPSIINNSRTPFDFSLGSRSTIELLGYRVYRDDTLVTPTLIAPNTFTFSETASGQGYYVYTVVAEYNTGDSPLRRVTAIVGNPVFNSPTNLTIVAGTRPNEALLTWTAPVAQIPTLLGYHVYRDGVRRNTELLSTPELNDFDLINGMEYRYHVVAVYNRPTGNSAPTAVVPFKLQGTTAMAYPPSNLVAKHEEGVVELTWDKPVFVESFEGQWITHSPHNLGTHGWGAGDGAYDNIAAHRFTPEMLAELGVAGKELIAFGFSASRSSDYAQSLARTQFVIYVWVGGTWSESPTGVRDPGTLVSERYLPLGSVQQGWNNARLLDPVTIPTDEELWIGYRARAVAPAGFPMSIHLIQPGPSPDFRNHLANLQHNATNGWHTPMEINAGHHLNFLLRGLVQIDGGNVLCFGNTNDSIDDFLLTEIANTGIATISDILPLEVDDSCGSRNFLGYNIYREGVRINDELLTVESFIDTEAPAGRNEYFVRASYAVIGDSRPSNVVPVVVRFPPVVYVHRWHLPWVEDFSDPEALNNLFTLRAGVGTDRLFSRVPTFGYGGSAGVASLSGQGATHHNPDAWLITPRIVIHRVYEDDKIFFRFKVQSRGTVAGDNFRENYSVLITTEDSSQIEAFKEVIFTEETTAPGWNEREIDITRFGNLEGDAQIVIAIRHHDTKPGNFQIVFDDLEVYVIPGVSEYEPEVPSYQTALQGNFPNPFNPETSIAFSMANEGNVSIEIFNIRGQRINTLLNETRTAGQHQVVWNGKDEQGRSMSSGIYFYRMVTDEFTSTKRMVLMK